MVAPIVAAATLAAPRCPRAAEPPCRGGTRRFSLLVHGGAGSREQRTAIRKARRKTLASALRAGAALLARGRSAVDAVEAAVVLLENSPLFNAGRGGIPNKAGFVELDASIMDGHGRDAGAVAAVRRIKNPIRAARAAMERSEHLMFVDRGAVAFARHHGLKLVAPKYFLVPGRNTNKASKGGTVGAVALDRCGHLAAATSTGGYNAKTPGRVGDSPIIGAGTYATRRCAVSATGHGEYFIRYAAAHDVCALVAYKGWSIGRAASAVIRKLAAAGGRGGFIALDAKGHHAWPFSTPSMIRGRIDHRSRLRVGTARELRR